MQWKLLNKLALALLVIYLFISCKKELSCENCKGNKPPIAKAGADETVVLPKDSLLLDGTASSDPEGKIATWQWTKITGPNSILFLNAKASKTMVKNLSAGAYQFELKITDDAGLTAKDTVQVIVSNPATNQPPIANAGMDQIATLPYNNIVLNGSASSDPEKDITAYLWTKVTGPPYYNIATPNAVQTAVTNLVEGVYQFELKVTDAGGLFSQDTVQVTVKPDPALICDISGRPVVTATLTEIGKLSVPRVPAVGAAGNKIVFAGGNKARVCGTDHGVSSDAVDIYDITYHGWSSATLSQERSDITVASGGNKILFAGGINWEIIHQGIESNVHYDNVDIYDATNNSWSLAHLSKARINICAVTIGNKIIFAGGTFYTGLQTPIAVDVVDIYDVSTNSWSTAKLSVARWGISGVVIGDKAYFAGGKDSNGTTAVDVYTLSTNTWSTSTLPEDIALQGSIQVSEYLFWRQLNQVRIKNINTGIATSNCVSGNIENYGGLKNDNLIFFTGYDPNFALIRFDIYNTRIGTWSVGKPDQLIAGTVRASTITVSNTIYLAGGISGHDECNLTYGDKVYTLNW